MFKTRSLVNNIALVTFGLLIVIIGALILNVYIWSGTIREVYFPKQMPNKNEAIDERIVGEARELLIP